MAKSSPASVRVYPRRGDAEVAAAVLRAEGIDSVVVAEDEGGLNPGFFSSFGVRLSVRPEDLARACEALGIETLRLPHEVAAAMVQQARFVAPTEACGLFASDGRGRVVMAYPLTNIDASERRFTVAPQEHYGAWKHASRNGWTIAGVFHSHPRTAAYPSAADVAGALDPSWYYVIVGQVLTRPEIRAYRIVEGVVSELDVVVDR